MRPSSLCSRGPDRASAVTLVTVESCLRKGVAQVAAKVDIELCTGCGICVGVCPANAIEIHDGKAHVDAEVCVECGLCVGECPQHAISLE